MTFNSLTPWKRAALTRRDDESSMSSLQREMNDLLNRFFKASDFPSFGSFEEIGSYNPKVDVKETEKELVVSAELPGMTERDITVSVAKDYLTISGEKKTEKEEDVKGYYHMERSYGSFRRTMPLPYEVNGEKAQATFKDGLLTIHLPKHPDTQKGMKTVPIAKG